jgi:tetratricopeptide (TPR) repeat protein
MGEALAGQERTADAIAEFQAAVKAAPREPNIHFGLGYLYRKSQQYEEAKAAFEAEYAIDPGNALALAYVGDIELKMNHPERALELLKKALQQKDDLRIAYVDMGAIYSDRKEYDAAVAAYRKAIKLEPDQPDMHFRLGHVYQAMGNMPAAETEYAKFRALHKKADEDLMKMMSDAPPALHP